ncbi:AMP-binding protein [Phreatobacter stygius]|uniref:AMP-dependent synthetase n=1 Tax=Phreatobacter stygius TaxID=1940610 RepID=A0A4D7AUC2_9HYPH|nr:AMP-binding protein [Phreatobacter stygius]QCI63221.1 hypothetical protein E8M01_02600 [Phreatobacter stygius]
MAPAHVRSKPLDQDLHAVSELAAACKWSNAPDHALDQGGPLFRPYQRMGVDFADIPVVDHLKSVTTRHPDKLAISDGTDRLTYAALLQAVETLSRRIAAVVPDGQAIGIFLANSAWYPVAMLASMAAGRPAVPLNTRDPRSRIDEIAATARLSAVMCLGSADQAGWTQKIRWIDVAAGGMPAGRRTPAPPLSRSVSVEAPAIVLYTPGGTGHPQGIVNSQRSLLRRVQHYVDACHINAEDVFLPLAGLATIAGCREILAALLSGATLHLIEVEAVGLRAVRGRMRADRVTVTCLAPALLRPLLADAAVDAFRSLRLARIEGEAVSWTDIAPLRQAVSKACLIQIGYGSAAANAAQWFLPPDWPDHGPSVPAGRLLPGLSFAIVDEDGRPVRPDESGELLIRGPDVLLGHWDSGTVMAAESDPDDPALRIVATGDLARLDDQGLLRIVGRKGGQIQINGAVAAAPAGNRLAPRQDDTLPILFLLPGSVGYGPSFAAFAASMGKVARVAPVRYPGLQQILSGQNSLAAIATAAIGQIDRTQPSGSVRLLGHSLGGAVAFEVAARLLAAGRSVTFLGILDTSIVGEPRDYRETLIRTIHRIRTNRVTASRMVCRALAKVTVALGCEARLARILDRHPKGQFNATCFRIKLELQEVLRSRAFFAWLAGPKPMLPITATLFRCNRPGMPEALGWDRAFTRLDVVPIAGGHLDLIVEPHLATNRPLIEKAVAETYSPAETGKREKGS